MKHPSGVYKLLCPTTGRTLFCIAADSSRWSEPHPRPDGRHLPPAARAKHDAVWGDRTSVTLPDPPWEHVSVSVEFGLPVWAEMCFVRDAFFAPEDCVVQFHPPHADYVDIHEQVLHLWKVVGAEFPMPPKECV